MEIDNNCITEVEKINKLELYKYKSKSYVNIISLIFRYLHALFLEKDQCAVTLQVDNQYL